MKIRNLFFGALIISMTVQCKTQQFETGSSRNGKCYAKCLVEDKAVTEMEEYVVYTGNEEEEDVEVIQKEIVIKPGVSKWVKKKADKNCRSADPNDCLVWCLVKEDPIVRTVNILVDTTQSNNYELERIKKEVERIEGRSFEWKEVVCAKDITKSLISEIQQALRYNLSYNGAVNGELDQLTKNALRSFQEKNNLSVGQLDFETLDVLGVVVD